MTSHSVFAIGSSLCHPAWTPGDSLLSLVLSVLSSPVLPEVDRMVQRFSHETISNYSLFLVEPHSGTLFVGAKDAILALRLEAISQHARKVSRSPVAVWLSPGVSQESSIATFRFPFVSLHWWPCLASS